jgi:hypothetical protein
MKNIKAVMDARRGDPEIARALLAAATQGFPKMVAELKLSDRDAALVVASVMRIAEKFAAGIDVRGIQVIDFAAFGMSATRVRAHVERLRGVWHRR